MNLENVNEIASKLKTLDFKENDGDKVIVSKIDNDNFYAYVDSKKRGFGSMIIGKDLSYLFFSSGTTMSKALEDFNKGVRSN